MDVPSFHGGLHHVRLIGKICLGKEMVPARGIATSSSIVRLQKKDILPSSSSAMNFDDKII